MAMFKYSGRDSSGNLVNGNIEANDRNGVASQLLANGVIPVDIKEQTIATNDSWARFRENYLVAKVGLDDLIMFSRQMHSLTRAGVVINKAVRGLAQSTRSERLQKALFDIERGLNTGVNLATCMRRHHQIFGELYINIVQVGENSGALDKVFKQLAEYLEREKHTRRSVTSALRYPSFVLTAIGLALVVLNIWVIPVFANMFAKFHSELPLPTKILIATSNLFLNYWTVMLIVVAVAVYGWKYFLTTPQGKLWWGHYKLKLPVVGNLLDKAMLSRFCHTFALMLRSGVPLMQAMELCSKAVDNHYMGGKILEMRTGVERGESLLRITTASNMFSPLVLQMIAVGEETGQVDSLLEEAATFYDEEVEYDLKSLSSKIEPILIVGIAGIVGVLAMGIFLPMWEMFNVMQGK